MSDTKRGILKLNKETIDDLTRNNQAMLLGGDGWSSDICGWVEEQVEKLVNVAKELQSAAQQCPIKPQ